MSYSLSRVSVNFTTPRVILRQLWLLWLLWLQLWCIKVLCGRVGVATLAPLEVKACREGWGQGRRVAILFQGPSSGSVRLRPPPIYINCMNISIAERCTIMLLYLLGYDVDGSWLSTSYVNTSYT